METLRESTRHWDAPKLKKNTFDLTHNHPLTANLGRLFPVYTDVMPANTSLHVKPSWSFKMKPFLQDMQTNIKCHFQLWRVPVRLIWDNFEKFSRQDPSQDSRIAHPYIARDERWVNVGELADYFGIPSQTFATQESGVFNVYDGFGGTDHKSYNEYGSLIHPTVNYSSNDNGFRPFKDTLSFDYVERKTPYACPVHGVLVNKMDIPGYHMWDNQIYGNGVTFQDFLTARNECRLLAPASDLSRSSNIQYTNYCCIEQPISMPLKKAESTIKVNFWSALKDDVSRNNSVGDKHILLFKGASPTTATYFATIYSTTGASQDFLNSLQSSDFGCPTSQSNQIVNFNVPFVNQALQTAPQPLGIYLNTYNFQLAEDQVSRINSVIENEPIWMVLVNNYTQTDLNRFFDPYGFADKQVLKELADMGECPYSEDDDKYKEWWTHYYELSAQHDENASYHTTLVPCGFQALHNLSGLIASETLHNVTLGFANVLVSQFTPSTLVGAEPFTPFEGRNPKQPISALPFRAFEAIYNFRYRVKELDPFMKDGVICVDDWCSNHGDGADSTTPVHIDDYRVSYPEDYFFGAMPKPSGYDCSRN